MREILFRGKRIDNGEWVEGLPSYDMNGNLEEMEVYKGFCNCDTLEVDPETVCQYTGLTDKNGRKIFEGDIVECRTRKDGYDKYKVIWCKPYADFRIEPFNFGVQFPIGDFEGKNIRGGNYIVIGNIFDNPELIGDRT